MLRTLLPSWRFFDRPGPALRLELRLKEAEGFGPWQTLFAARSKRGWRELFSNAFENFRLHTQSLLEQFQEDVNKVSSSAQLRSCLSYQLTEALVRSRLEGSQAFQFRVLSEADCLICSELLRA